MSLGCLSIGFTLHWPPMTLLLWPRARTTQVLIRGPHVGTLIIHISWVPTWIWNVNAGGSAAAFWITDKTWSCIHSHHLGSRARGNVRGKPWVLGEKFEDLIPHEPPKGKRWWFISFPWERSCLIWRALPAVKSEAAVYRLLIGGQMSQSKQFFFYTFWWNIVKPENQKGTKNR